MKSDYFKVVSVIETRKGDDGTGDDQTPTRQTIIRIEVLQSNLNKNHYKFCFWGLLPFEIEASFDEIPLPYSIYAEMGLPNLGQSDIIEASSIDEAEQLAYTMWRDSQIFLSKWRKKPKKAE